VAQPGDESATPAQDAMATPGQMEELRSLAGADQDLPEGMRASEAQQRIVELKTAR
jgi:hypothetical protein